MPTFNLTANSKTYILDTNGSFTEGANNGSWSVLETGEFEIRPTGSARVKLPGEWKFDTKNHLLVAQGGTTIFDFTDNDPKLEMALADNVLQVWPNGADNFKFELPFVWSVTANFKNDGKLQASLNGINSVVSGQADKAGNRFVYIFRRTDAAGAGPAGPRPNRLAFSGAWKNSSTGDAGGLDVRFEYTVDGTAATLQFPAGLWSVDTTKGSLYLDYGSGPGRKRLEISGDFQLSATARLSFSFTHTVAGATVTNTLTFATTFDLAGQTSPTQLSLSIADASAPGGQRTITVGGKFSYQSDVLGLSIAFSAQKTTGGALPQPISLALVLTAKLKTGGAIELSVKTAGGVTTLSLTASQVKLTNGVSATLGLNVIVAGKQKYVSGFLAFSW